MRCVKTRSFRAAMSPFGSESFRTFGLDERQQARIQPLFQGGFTVMLMHSSEFSCRIYDTQTCIISIIFKNNK